MAYSPAVPYIGGSTHKAWVTTVIWMATTTKMLPVVEVVTPLAITMTAVRDPRIPTLLRLTTSLAAIQVVRQQGKDTCTSAEDSYPRGERILMLRLPTPRLLRMINHSLDNHERILDAIVGFPNQGKMKKVGSLGQV